MVDDLFPVFNHAGRPLRDLLATVLEKRVVVKYMGEVHWALKMRIFRDKKKGITKIPHESFIWEFLTSFDLLKLKPKTTPPQYNFVLPDPKNVSDDGVESMKKFPFREIIGSFFYGCVWLQELIFSLQFMRVRGASIDQVAHKGKSSYAYLRIRSGYCTLGNLLCPS